VLEMLQAHGLEAGPTQRPLAAGAIGGVLADLPALALLFVFGTLERLASAVNASMVTTALLHGGVAALAGMGYGLMFRRAANDIRGGWLFGMAYGYLVWQSIAVPLLQWLPDEPLLQGRPALGLLLAHLAWGLVLGLAFGRVHRPLKGGLDDEKASGKQRAGGW
jgi:hypothetical protein